MDDDVIDAPVGEELWGTPIFDARGLRRIVLRYFVSDLIASQPARVWSPTELGEAFAARGFHVTGRPAKVISDALRSEVNREVLLARELARATRHRFT